LSRNARPADPRGNPFVGASSSRTDFQFIAYAWWLMAAGEIRNATEANRAIASPLRWMDDGRTQIRDDPPRIE
jgi:hypothetical protein